MNFSKKNHEHHKVNRTTVSKQITIFVAILFCSTLVGQSIYKSSIDSGGASASSGDIQVLYTIGEVNVQESAAGNIILSEGFISPQEIAIKIDPSCFLQGPYNAGTMQDGLRSNGVIPTTSPYTDAISCDASVFNTTGNDAIIDWVWLELRDSADGITVIFQTSALIQADGDIVDVDGTSAITANVSAGNYYLMISHRNHLGILTASTVSLSGGTTTVDLTNNSALVEGTTNAVATLGDGNFALFAGDFNGDGQIQNPDKNGVEPLRGISGYNNGDINLDNDVQNTDINILNQNLGRGEQFMSRNLNAKRNTTIKHN